MVVRFAAGVLECDPLLILHVEDQVISCDLCGAVALDFNQHVLVGVIVQEVFVIDNNYCSIDFLIQDMVPNCVTTLQHHCWTDVGG